MRNSEEDPKIIGFNFYFAVRVKIVNPARNFIERRKILDATASEWRLNANQFFEKALLN